MAFYLPQGLNPAEDPQWQMIEMHLGAPGVRFVEPPQNINYIFVCFTNRSGSMYLAELLATTGFFNLPQEDLNAEVILDACETCQDEEIVSFADYFAYLVRMKSMNGYFCVKSTIGQIGGLIRHGILEKIIGKTSFIIMERQDKLAQAISLLIATQTNQWTSVQDSSDVEPVYDELWIRDQIYDSLERERRARTFFGLNGIVPIHASYENLLVSPKSCLRTICQALGQPSLECRPEHVRLKPQRSSINREWRHRFLNPSAITR